MPRTHARQVRTDSERVGATPIDGPVRVCHLAKFYPPAPGGMETHVRVLAQAQAALGAEVEVVCVNHADSAGRDVTFRAMGRTPNADEWDGPVRVRRVGRLASLARLE